MALIKIENIEVIDGLTIDVSLDQLVQVNEDYLDISNYVISPSLTISSIEDPSSPYSRVIRINLTHHMLNNQQYTITVDNIINLDSEPFAEGGDTYQFFGEAESPAIVDVQATSESNIRVTFDRIVDESTATVIGNYVINSNFTGHKIVIDNVAYSSTFVDLAVNNSLSYMTHDFEHTIRINNVKDFNGNVIAKNSSFNFDGLTTTFTKLTEITIDSSVTPNRLYIAFDGALDEQTAEGLDSFSFVPDSGGFPAYYSSAKLSNDGKTVILEITETTAAIDYTVFALDALYDVFGNNIDPSENFDTFTGIGVSPDLAYVKYISRNLFSVHFSEPMRNNDAIRDASNYSFSGGLTVSAVVTFDNDSVRLATSNADFDTSYTLTITTADIKDAAGNALNVPTNATVTTPSKEAIVDAGIDLYEFLTLGVRIMDENEGGLLLKRYLQGFQDVFDDNNERMEKITELFDLNKVPDAAIPLLAAEFGWEDFTDFNEKFTLDERRKIYSISADLWKRRGANNSISETLSTILGTKSFEANYFDDYWELGTDIMDENRDNTDCILLSPAGIYTTFLNVVDPDRIQDRDCIREFVRLWKPGTENVTITYADVYEPFFDTFDATEYVIEDVIAAIPNTNYTVANGTITMDNSAEHERLYASNTFSDTWDDMAIYARLKSSNTTTGTYGIVARFLDTNTNHYEFTLDPSTDNLTVVQNAVTLETVNLLSDFDIQLNDEEYYGMRVLIESNATQDLVIIYVANILVLKSYYTTLNSTGSAGFFHKPNTELEVDFFEVFPLPSETETIS